MTDVLSEQPSLWQERGKRSGAPTLRSGVAV